MQKIFSQELRFKDDNGEDYTDWEYNKIEDVFEITRGYVLAMPEVKQEKNGVYLYPVYSSQTKNNGLS
jgi:type I restriction enzyme S subunit